MDNFEKAFLNYLAICNEALIETAEKNNLDCEKAIELFKTSGKSGWNDEDPNYKLLLLGSALTNYEIAQDQTYKNPTKKIVHLLRGYAAFAHLEDNATFQDYASIHGKNMVKLKLANDPIQKAKREIEQHYEKQKSQFKRRGYSAEFNREMHKQYPVITDIKTIERLVAELNKKNEHIPPKLAKR